MTSVTVRRVAADDTQLHEDIAESVRTSFLPREAACVASGVSQSAQGEKDLMDLVRAVLKDGVSVAAFIDGTLVGYAVNKIQVPTPAGEASFFERFAKETATDHRARWVLDFMKQVDAMSDLFAAVDNESLLELMFLGVAPEAARRGVGLAVSTESVRVAREVGVRGVCSILTSEYSRAITRRLGFEELVVASHRQFLFEGKPMSEKLPAHQQNSVLALLKLD